MATIWTEEDIITYKAQLEHVLWVGGATDGGKSTTASLLAEKYDLLAYHGDMKQNQWENITAQEQPAMLSWWNMSIDERWVTPSTQSLTQLTLKIMAERLRIMVKDLSSLETDKQIVAEWYGFMPDYIMPLISSPDKALWLFPNEEFKQQSITKRNKANFHRNTSDPRTAWHNHLQRDLKLAEIAKEQAKKHNFTIVINDGILDPQAILRQVESHFLAHLPRI